MPRFKKLAIPEPCDLRFGTSPRPLITKRGMTIGGGLVYPELNFTLPTMVVDASTMKEIREQYHEIITDATQRGLDLETPGLVIEFETLPPMTENPLWTIQITEILHEEMERAYARGLKSVLRVTPTDIRDMSHPPRMRDGAAWERMLETFDGCAAAGAELLSIESTGGKEVHDGALLSGDLSEVLFALCIMGARDMQFLWNHIVEIAKVHGVHAAGDTACGFANTAMVLAEQGMLPRVFAAVVRVISAVRSLVAYECGAVGPGKDCAYENPILKAITGLPMAMEGKTSACAHLTRVGNIAAATCDTWSNESVQNIRLLGGMAPTCYLEQLVYDCRLMNEASADGRDAALVLQKWMIRSDAALDPQAHILGPENVVTIAKAIVDGESYYAAGRAAADATLNILRSAVADKSLRLGPREIQWLDRMERTLHQLPGEEEEFIAQVVQKLDHSKFRLEDYDLRLPVELH
jgi:methanol---5-hydroxybenzimidazolylcobamide Co-methyltransferase